MFIDLFDQKSKDAEMKMMWNRRSHKSTRLKLEPENVLLLQ